MEDQLLESKKQNRFTEEISVKSSSSLSSKSHGEQEEDIKSDEAIESDAERTLEASLEDDVDESDVEEEDVKVCDICGDAGREDLLAVCSRCSDGAEHTYCMREMLDKVPEGDWICEECKLNEELEAQKQEHPKMLGASERNLSFGRTGSVNYDKLDNKESLCELNKIKKASLNKQLPSKRPGDSIETGTTAKRQALESSIISPKMSSPGRVAVLSKDSSFKNLDKTKRKSTNQISSGTESTSDSSENVRSPTTSSLLAVKGNFSKSNSFSSTNSKPNVKVSDEGSQKQKQGLEVKDGPGKLIGKSMSFKGLGRSNVSEPKVKMLSAKCSPLEESKCQKQARERISFEKKSTIKLDHSFVPPVATNATRRPFRGDNVSSSSVSNNGDHKNAQTDLKQPTMSKHAFHSLQRSSDSTAGSAEAKKQLSTSVSGSAFVNGISSSSEAKAAHVNLKEGQMMTSSRTADRSSLGGNGAKVDLLDSQSDKSLDNSLGRSKQSVGAPMVSGNRRGLSADASGSKAKEGIHEENKLKAAIEAAMQKKQDIFKKHRTPEKPVELSLSNTQGNCIEDAGPNQAADAGSKDEVPEGDLFFRESNSGNQMSSNSVKQLKVYPADFVHSSFKESAMRVSAIPEQESVWQGAFEIHRNGKLPDMCGGFQAHLSSFASGKVIEVVKKFPQKLVLDEVTRPCAWPVQFKEAGVREDNIALYFFAKDLESYVRSYKILLDYLIKHDLALKGNISGVELLVFPSNHLPDKSQCWNSLLFLWGVFRGRKSHSPDKGDVSLENPEVSICNMIPRDNDAASATSFSENQGLQRPATEDLAVSQACVSVVRPSNGDCYKQQYAVRRAGASPQILADNVQKEPCDHSQGAAVGECPQSGKSASKDQDNCYEGKNVPIGPQEVVQDIDKRNHLHEPGELTSFSMLRKHLSTHTSKVAPVGQRDSASVAICNHADQVKSEDSLKQEHDYVDNFKKNAYQVKLEHDRKQQEETECMGKISTGNLKSDYGFEKEGCVDINISADSNINLKKNVFQVKLEHDRKQEEEELSRVGMNNTGKLKLEGGLMKEVYVDINVSADSIMEDASDVHPTESIFTCKKRPWMDGKGASKFEDQINTNKRTDDGTNGCDLHRLRSSFNDRLATQVCGASTSSHVKDTSNTLDDEKSTAAVPGNAQRYFFLVDSYPSQSNQSRDDSMSWKGTLPENEDRFIDGSPNLELALGVEKKQSRKGMLPFFAGIVDKNDPEKGPPDITTSKEEEDASASLSLSLAFPFTDKERSTRIERPTANVEQVLPGRHEVNAQVLLFRGSSGK